MYKWKLPLQLVILQVAQKSIAKNSKTSANKVAQNGQQTNESWFTEILHVNSIKLCLHVDLHK